MQTLLVQQLNVLAGVSDSLKHTAFKNPMQPYFKQGIFAAILIFLRIDDLIISAILNFESVNSFNHCLLSIFIICVFNIIK